MAAAALLHAKNCNTALPARVHIVEKDISAPHAMRKKIRKMHSRAQRLRSEIHYQKGQWDFN